MSNKKFKGTTENILLDELVWELFEKRFTLKDFHISKKIVSDWNKQDLFLDAKAKGWRKYSMVDYVWVRLLEELRDFGMPIESLKALKTEMLEPVDLEETMRLVMQNPELLPDDYDREAVKNSEHSPSDVSKLELDPEFEDGFTFIGFLVFNFIIKRYDYQFIIKPTGELMVDYAEGREFMLQHGLKEFLQSPNINLSLAYIMQEFVVKEESFSTPLKVDILNNKEREVIRHIRKDNVKELKVRFTKDNEINLLETTEVVQRVNLEKNFLNHILKGGYQDIAFSTQDGNVVSFTKTNKYKL